MTQLSLLINPRPSRHDDHDTSRQAGAKHAAPTIGSDLHLRILGLLRTNGPMHDGEIIERIPDRKSGTVVKRRTELYQAGRVDGVDTRDGRIVWGLV